MSGSTYDFLADALALLDCLVGVSEAGRLEELLGTEGSSDLVALRGILFLNSCFEKLSVADEGVMFVVLVVPLFGRRWLNALTTCDDAGQARRDAKNQSRGHASHATRIADMATRFEARKQKLLEQLDIPEGEYHDLSPKGSIDAPIRNLIDEINALDGLVTTSSCSGRISVFLEGRKADHADPASAPEVEQSRAGPGGKGGGGAWLYISHTPVEATLAPSGPDFMSMFGLNRSRHEVPKMPAVSCRYIHLKFEPMVSSLSSVLGFSKL